MSRAINFALVSFGLHAIVLAILSSDLMFNAVGFGASSDSASTVTTVEIHLSQVPTEVSQVTHDFGSLHRTEQHRKTDTRQSPALPSEENVQPRGAEKPPAGISSSSQDVVAAGALTRMPVPITNIDLDVAEIKDIAAPGTVSFAIVIDADGSVVDVTSMHADPSLELFAVRVAEVFRRARFVPGEVNGKAVRTRLKINVVSENSIPL